ncbi:helix-turn-helix transcriptional regulator [Lichenicoccus sp.]|uniref:helix-turn-helix transcriptional regulator n=1 Tax=Lichenicoccus sp. TaxID=2781899 RepID=UPI003D0E8919
MLDGNSLGTYLRNRRTRLDPGSLGIAAGRRRTTGLRREEVAQRANISATWYTWLEQGRGGSPSADVLDRIGRALMLTAVEREHLFLVGLGRPPEVRYQAPDTITPRLQRLLDVLTYSPAVLRTARWDVVAWNRAAALVLTDYGLLPPDQRNILRMIFSHAPIGASMDAEQSDWNSLARFAVASFRIDAARAGADAEIAPLVAELCGSSPAFASMWHDQDVRAPGHDVKHLRHPRIGSIALEYSAFAVDARPDLSLIVFNPATSADQDRVRSLVDNA